MLFRSGYKLGLAGVVGALLLAGCAGGSAGKSRPAANAGPVPPDKPVQVSAEQNAIEGHAYYATALIHEMNGETDEALNAFHEAALRDPENESLVLEVSRRLLQSRQPERALELVKRATANSEASGALFARLGFIQFQLGNTDLAIAANRKGIRRDPQSLIGYQNLFLIHLQTGKTAEALKVLDEAARVSDPSPEFLIGLGEMYGNYGLQVPAQRQEVFQRGATALARALKQQPSDAAVQLRLADAFNMLGKQDEAARIYRELLGEWSDTPLLRDGIRAKLTDLYLRGRDTRQAAEQLENLIRENPTDVQSHYLLGSILYAETNYVAAADAFSRVIVLNPEFEQGYYDLAAAQLNEGKSDEAIETLAKAREKFPQKFFGEYLAGLAYSQKEDYTNALKHYVAAEIIAEATAQLRPSNELKDSFYFQLGATSERVGDYAQAEKYFEKCLELSPNHDEAQNYLGYMLAERGEKLDRAKYLIERALTADPENAAYLDSMGWVLFKLNQPSEALKYLIRAVENSEEEDATLYDHLGDVYAALNQPDKAQEAWKKAIAVEPNENIRKKLDALKP